METVETMFKAECAAVEAALKALYDKLKAAPKEDWRASLAYGYVEGLLDTFGWEMWEISAMPRPPADFRDKRQAQDDFPL